MKKKVSFYLLAQDQIESDKKRHTVPKSRIESNFNLIYSRMQELEQGERARLITHGKMSCVVEIIDYNPENHSAFLKIGQQNHSSTVRIRDQNSLETTEVPMTNTQRLELFTYCYIDFTTCIVSYIRVQGAPGITTLRSFFNEFLLGEFKISSSISAIMSSDILNTLKKKRISKLTVSVAVPSDEILSDKIGIERNAFDELQYVNKINYTYSISVKRLKSMFKDSQSLGNLVETLKERHGKDLRSLSVNASDNSEGSETFDLLLQNLTKTVEFSADNMTEITAEDFKSTIVGAYNTYKDELINYAACRL